eukprot:m.124975 g.124975  ORF g.124975 m.124975 type:complete len:158 (+) comp16640_c1_seq4:71-544(+)
MLELHALFMEAFPSGCSVCMCCWLVFQNKQSLHPTSPPLFPNRFANVQGLFVREASTGTTTVGSNDDDESSFGLGYIIAAGLGGLVLIVLVSLAVWHFCFPPERETWSLDDDVAARSESVRVARYSGQDEPAASETIKLQTIRPKGSVYINPYSTTA